MSLLNCTRSARVYFAAPKQTYSETSYDDGLERARLPFPAAVVLSPRELFTSNRDWLDQWPLILPTLDALVFITDSEGWVGKGVHKEVLDAASLAITVELLTSDGRFQPLADIEFADVDLRGWPQYARVSNRRSRTRRTR